MVLIALLIACNDGGVTVHNTAPEAEIVSPDDGSQVSEHHAITFVGNASDANNKDTLTAEWRSGDTVLCEAAAPSADGSVTCSAALTADQTTITLVVRDNKDASGKDSITLVVVPNEQPVVNISAPEADGAFFADELIAFEATVSDTEDHPEQLNTWWNSSLDGDLTIDASPDGSGVIANSGYLTAGQHEISLFATDTADNTGSDTVIITVNPPNSTPTCEITAPEDNSLGEVGEAVTFEALVSDVDISADQLTVSWSSDLEGTLTTSSPDSEGNVSYTTGDLSEGTHVVTLHVEDDLGATCTDDVLYSVGTPPSITMSSPNTGDVINVGSEVSFVATVSDPDNSPGELGMTWDSDVDGEFSTEGPDSSGSVSFTSDSLSRAEHTITATVTDPDGLYARAVATIKINGLPSAPSISLGPNPAVTTDDLEVTIDSDAVDPDGDSVSYSYTWYQDGVPRGAYTTDVVAASATSKHETWKVVVTPSDGHGSGSSDNASVTIDNTPPTAPTISIDPDDPMEAEDDFQCIVDVDSTDDDGDTISYTFGWKVDSTSYSDAVSTDETGDTIEGTETVAEEEWVCKVTPYDDDGAGTSSTATVYVLGEPVDYAHIQYPCSGSIARTTGTLDVYGWVYHPGVTDDYGQGAGISAEVGLGDDGTDPETDTSWTWTTATYNDDKPAYGDSTGDPEPYNNDEYLGTITAPSTTGSFDYAFRFSTDSGLSWTYVDLGGTECSGDGTIDGYDPADAGDLTVYP